MREFLRAIFTTGLIIAFWHGIYKSHNVLLISSSSSESASSSFNNRISHRNYELDQLTLHYLFSFPSSLLSNTTDMVTIQNLLVVALSCSALTEATKASNAGFVNFIKNVVKRETGVRGTNNIWARGKSPLHLYSCQLI
jgi:hypothetical protein